MTTKPKEVTAICKHCGLEIYEDKPCGFGEWYHKHNNDVFCIKPSQLNHAVPMNDADIAKQRTMDSIITQFFEGEDYFKINHEMAQLGFLWVAKHTGYDTLTFEPKCAGQYEIAVRFKVTPGKDDLNDAVWQGYKVADPFKDKLYGVNTRGH